MASADEKVKRIIVEQLGADEAEVTASTSFQDDLGADSQDIVELVMALKKPSTLRFRTGMPRKSKPSKDAIDYVNAHTKGGERA